MTFVRNLFLGFLITSFQNLILHAEVVREAGAFTCRQGNSETVQLRSTDRIPDAGGEARVELKDNRTGINVVVAGIKPASLFGGDYNTYVFWVVSSDGRVENLGELTLRGSQSELHTSTTMSSFAMLVTAEPHYLVRLPSAFVVLESRPDKQGSRISYQVREGVYNFKRSSLTDVKEAKGKVHTEVRQAFTAVRLAQRAGASDLAAEELKEAQRVLDQTLALLKGGRDRSEIEARAHEAIRLAVAAQNLATDRALLGARAIEEGSGGGTATLEGAIGEDLRHIQIKDQCK